MRTEPTSSRRRRIAPPPARGKTRISIFLDNAVIEAFRQRAQAAATGYQTMINGALKDYLTGSVEQPLTESRLRAVLLEILPPGPSAGAGRPARTARARSAS
jgi:hypothetical protein